MRFLFTKKRSQCDFEYYRRPSVGINWKKVLAPIFEGEISCRHGEKSIDLESVVPGQRVQIAISQDNVGQIKAFQADQGIDFWGVRIPAPYVPDPSHNTITTRKVTKKSIYHTLSEQLSQPSHTRQIRNPPIPKSMFFLWGENFLRFRLQHEM